MSDVGIYEVYIREDTTNMWLCPPCRAIRAKGKGARPPKQLDQPEGFAGRCDDCPRGPALSAVDFVPTGPGARRPTAAECPPPRRIPPWAKPKKAVTAKREPTTWSSDEEAA